MGLDISTQSRPGETVESEASRKIIDAEKALCAARFHNALAAHLRSARVAITESAEKDRYTISVAFGGNGTDRFIFWISGGSIEIACGLQRRVAEEMAAKLGTAITETLKPYADAFERDALWAARGVIEELRKA